MSVDVADLVARIRLKSGLKNNQYFKDDQLAGFASDGAAELFDLLVKANEHYFARKFPFVLAGGVGGNTVQRPADFYKEQLLELDYTAPYPTTVPMLGDLGSKNRAGAFGVLTNGGAARQWVLSGDTIEVIPAPAAAGNYQLRYTPILERLVLPSQIDLSVTFSPAPAIAARLQLDKYPVPVGGTVTVTVNEVQINFPASNLTGLVIDGVVPQLGDIVLFSRLLAPGNPVQDPSQEGLWVYNGLSLTAGLAIYQFNRLTNFQHGNVVGNGTRVKITDGKIYAGTVWANDSTWTVDTNLTNWKLQHDGPLTVDVMSSAPQPGAWSSQDSGNGLLLATGPADTDPFTVDGEDMAVGDTVWFTPADAPISTFQAGLWQYQGRDSVVPDYYNFTRPYGMRVNDSVAEPFPIIVRGGVTLRGSTWETLTTVIFGFIANFGMESLNSMAINGAVVLQKAEFDPSFVGGVLTIEGSPLGDRSYRVTAFTDEKSITVEGLDGAPVVFEAFGAPTVIRATHMLERYTIPQEMLPWQDYIVIHASVAVQHGRQQPSAALERKLEEFKARIAGMAMNRTEDVQQAPITRHLRNRGWGGTGGAW